MYIDKRLEFSDAQALSGTGAASTNVIDLGSDRDVGPGKPLWVVVTFDAALAGTSPTFEAQLQTDDNSIFSSPATIASSGSLSSAAVGKQLVIGVPYQNERYLRVNYAIGGTTPTATVSAWLTDQEPQSWQAYPDAI